MSANTQSLATPRFTGEFRHKVEGKGRITIPAKWRFDEEVELFFVAKTLKHCISVMTRAEVDRLEAAAEKLSPEERSEFLDDFGSSLRQATLDKAGRLSIPEDLVRDFKIAGEVWLSGSLVTFNIWNVADFETQKPQELARKSGVLRKLGI